MTRDEFEKGYAERSNIQVEDLHVLGIFAIPCFCDGEECEGWQMVKVGIEAQKYILKLERELNATEKVIEGERYRRLREADGWQFA